MVRAVNVFIRKGNLFLSVKRSKHDRIFAGMWAFPGGKVEENETDRECAEREILEETGLKLVYFENVIGVVNRLDIKGYPLSMVYVYKGEVSFGIPTPQDTEIERADWIDRRRFLDSLKEKNYPMTEAKKLDTFLQAEGLR